MKIPRPRGLPERTSSASESTRSQSIICIKCSKHSRAFSSRLLFFNELKRIVQPSLKPQPLTSWPMLQSVVWQSIGPPTLLNYSHQRLLRSSVWASGDRPETRIDTIGLRSCIGFMVLSRPGPFLGRDHSEPRDASVGIRDHPSGGCQRPGDDGLPPLEGVDGAGRHDRYPH